MTISEKRNCAGEIERAGASVSSLAGLLESLFVYPGLPSRAFTFRRYAAGSVG